MKTENENNFEKVAYHESGHIVIAYLSGYECDSVELLNHEAGTGKTRMNYGDDLMLFASITNCKTDPDFFNSLDKTQKSQSTGVSHRAATILLGGSAAESAYLNGGKVEGNMPVEVSGPDLERVDNIHFFLSQIKSDHDPNYIQETLRKVLLIISIPEVWTAIDSLAKTLLAKPNKKLGKTEIESILQESGYLDYIMND